jgi:uncharacterized protein with HEPN domain
MLDAARQARAYTHGLSKEAFLDDKRTQQAVILNFLVIGEAATRMANEYPEFVARNRELPWQGMRGMRNRMAHGYFEIDLNVVWDTVRTSLPDLEAKLRLLLDKSGDPYAGPE